MNAITKERIELFIKNPLENGLTRSEQMEVARIALASLEAEPVAVNDDMAYAFHHALSYSSLGADEVEEIKAGLRAAFANVTIQPEPVGPDEIEPDDSNTFDYVDGWNACRAAMLHSAEPVSQAYKLNALDGNSPVTPGRLPGGFTIEDAKELHENLVRSHISQALSGEKMKKKDRDADLRWIHGVIVQAAWFVKASLEQTTLSGTPPVTTDGWISCSERMPENIPGSCKEYLVFDGLNNKVHHDYWVVPDGDSAPVASFWNHYGAHVTHWMPLPEPPQEAK